jgi:hypothetical protein
MENARITITDSSGRIVYDAPFADSRVLNLSQFTAGLYHVVYTDAKEKAVKPLLISR